MKQKYFFKVAAATGWDCPRAQILIKLGNGKIFHLKYKQSEEL